MAQLPGYQQRKIVEQQATPGAAPVDRSMSRALSGVGQGLAQFAQVQNTLEEREARDYTIKSQNEMTVGLEAERLRLTNESTTGSQYVDGIDGYINTAKQKALEAAPNQKAADLTSEYFDSLLARENAKAVPVAAKMNAQNTAAVTKEALQISFNETQRSPVSYTENLEKGALIIATSDIPESEKERSIKAYESELAWYRFSGMVSDNPQQAKNELESGDWDAILPPNQMANLISKADQQIESVKASSRNKLSKELNDYISYKSAGGEEKKNYSEQSLKAVYGEEKGAEIYAQIQDVNSFADEYQKIKLASPSDIQKIISSQEVTGPEDFKTQSGQYKSVVAAVNERNKNLSNDPAKYSLQSDNVTNAYNEYLQTGDGRNYAITTMSEQQRLGVPVEYVSVFTSQEAKAIVGKFNAGDEEAATLISSLKDQFGDSFPIVMRDLNRAGLSPHASLVSILDIGPATYLSQASKAGYKVMSGNVGKDNQTDITTQVKEAIDSSFSETVNGTPSGISMKNQIVKSTELLAMYYLDTGMADSANDASQKAYKDVVGDRYTFQDGYRVPKEVEGYTPDASAIEQSLDGILDDIDSIELMVPFSDLPDDLAQRVYKRRLNPTWQTRGDDAGVELVDQNMQAVLTADGQKIFYTWSELEAEAPTSEFTFGGLGGL
ncbi:coil containing protein [Vibrio phage 1.182.O._10N.286.46.E1]|nr:coil containing protein [Vibrio phage 1.182.O._10N.286.46.E1]